MDAIQQQSHRPLKPMVDPHQHQDQNQNQHPPGVPWYPGQFQYQSSGAGAPPQQWVPTHRHNPSMDQSMQGQHQQPQTVPSGTWVQSHSGHVHTPSRATTLPSSSSTAYAAPSGYSHVFSTGSGDHLYPAIFDLFAPLSDFKFITANSTK